jgi:hypothetical protein
VDDCDRHRPAGVDSDTDRDRFRFARCLGAVQQLLATDTSSLLAATAVAVVALPFVLGYWIGNSVLAAAPFAALGLTVLIRQLELNAAPDELGKLLLGIVVSTAISATAAYAGGRTRERHRH